jgi:hypothetical protein
MLKGLSEELIRNSSLLGSTRVSGRAESGDRVKQ